MDSSCYNLDFMMTFPVFLTCIRSIMWDSERISILTGFEATTCRSGTQPLYLKWYYNRLDFSWAWMSCVMLFNVLTHVLKRLTNTRKNILVFVQYTLKLCLYTWKYTIRPVLAISRLKLPCKIYFLTNFVLIYTSIQFPLSGC